MALTYTTWTGQLANLMAVDPTIASTNYDFQTFLPGCIDYAEQRMYRELDLLATRVTDTAAYTANTRNVALPTNNGTFLVIEEANSITPVNATTSSGTRVPMQMVSKSFIDTVYPSNYTGTGVPQYMTMLTNATLSVAPAPDQAYTVEFIGTIRPTPLSSNNTTTILTTLLPDAFMAASMVFASGYMRNFGSQGDDPQMAASWEGQYTKLITTANVEELRKKYQSQAWQSNIPTPIATPQRV
jgi:hypothetical protein